MSSKTQVLLVESPDSRASSRSRRASVPDVSVRRVGVIGLGRIGLALVARLNERNRDARDARFLPVVALTRRNDPDRILPADLPVVTDPERVFDFAPDIVVEATGAVDGVRDTIARALSRGISVVTANKALVAAHGVALSEIARESGAAFRFEACAAAGIPIFALAGDAWRSVRFRSLTAILNGTSHFVLERIADGESLTDALKEARLRGFAEPDASDDLSGLDAARKAVILARAVLGKEIGLDAIDRLPINETTALAALAALGPSRTLKPVVRIECIGDRVEASVAPVAIPSSSPLASLRGAENGIVLEEEDGTRHFLAGPGAGPKATTDALIDDLLRVAEKPGAAGEGRR